MTIEEFCLTDRDAETFGDIGLPRGRSQKHYELYYDYKPKPTTKDPLLSFSHQMFKTQYVKLSLQ